MFHQLKPSKITMKLKKICKVWGVHLEVLETLNWETRRKVTQKHGFFPFLTRLEQLQIQCILVWRFHIWRMTINLCQTRKYVSNDIFNSH